MMTRDRASGTNIGYDVEIYQHPGSPSARTPIRSGGFLGFDVNIGKAWIALRVEDSILHERSRINNRRRKWDSRRKLIRNFHTDIFYSIGVKSWGSRNITRARTFFYPEIRTCYSYAALFRYPMVIQSLELNNVLQLFNFNVCQNVNRSTSTVSFLE